MTKHGSNRKGGMDKKLKGAYGQTQNGPGFGAAEDAIDGVSAATRPKYSRKTILLALAVATMLAINYGLLTQTMSSSIIPSASAADTPSDNAVTEEGYQVIRMNVTAAGWQPKSFALKKGVPVKWVIDGQQLNGCNKAIKVPSLGISFNIKPGLQTIEFTPDQEGLVPWSCWMGMIKGTFVVKADIDLSDKQAVEAAITSAPAQSGGGSCGGGGGGCGCGMMGGQ